MSEADTFVERPAHAYVPPEVIEFAVGCRCHGFSHPYADLAGARRNLKAAKFCPDAKVFARFVRRGPWEPQPDQKKGR